MQTQTEELIHRLQRAAEEIMKADPVRYSSSLRVLEKYFEEHVDPVQLVYVGVLVRPPADMSPLAIALGAKPDSDHEIELHVAFTIDCSNCNKVHRQAINPVSASFTDAEEVFKLAENLHKILNIL